MEPAAEKCAIANFLSIERTGRQLKKIVSGNDSTSKNVSFKTIVE